MLTVFYENNSYEALKRSAKDISAWTESTRKKVQQTTNEEEGVSVCINCNTIPRR